MQSLDPPVNLSNMLRLGMNVVSAPIETSVGIDLHLQGDHVLVVDDCSPLTPLLVQQLRNRGMRPLVLQTLTDSAPARTSALDDAWAPIIQCHAADPMAVEQHLARIRAVNGGLAGIIFLSTTIIPFQQQWFAQASQRLKVAIATVRGANLANETPLKFVYFVTAQGGRFGMDAREMDALASGLEALAHPLRLELPKTSFRTIDLDPSTAPAEQVQQLLQELSQPDQPYRTAYGWQQGQRVTLSVAAIDRPEKGTIGLDASSVVVFAGGARGIGAVCAKSLASQVNCHLIFLGRTPLTDEIWELSRLSPTELQQRSEQFIQDFKAANPGCPPRAPRAAWRQKSQALEAISTLQAVQSLGAKTDYFALDVRDRSAVNGLFLQLQHRFRKIDVIVHVAGLGGVDTDRMLLRKDWSTIDQVIDTKVIGALHLLEAARKADVKLFLGFGSIASRFGNTGQVDYAAANGLLNGIARAHNATGQSPVARVLSWGAWDGVGMAVSGPTKDMLLAYGLKFISPEAGAACFVKELATELSPSLPAELYISPAWAALTQLLADQGTQDAPTYPPAKPKLLGTVLELRPQEFIQAEHLLHPQQICFLDHHRYKGTAWVPAVMGMEVAVEAAATLFPEKHPVALLDIILKKAVRLVRDEPVVLLTKAQIVNTFGDVTHVEVTLSAQFKGRTWVFAEMRVLMSPNQQQSLLAPSMQSEPSRCSLPPSSPDLFCQTRSQLYPSEWLRFHTQGTTFQVLDELWQNCQAGYAHGQLTNSTDLSGYKTPLTWVDGCLQAYGELLSNHLESWAGPPLRIGEIRWLPELLTASSATVHVNLQTDHFLPSQVYLQDAQGRCLLSISQLEFGGTGVQEQKPSRGFSSLDIAIPYLGDVIEEIGGQRLVAEQVLDPKTDILLNDHRFPFLNGSFIFVPAVYFMEVAVEAAVRLTPGSPPVEVQNFHVHRALHFIQEPQRLIIEAEVIAPGKTHVRMSSRRGDKITLHSEALVLQGSYVALMKFPFQPLIDSCEVRTKSELYPQRFPNGPVFQVIDQMRLGEGHFSQSHLKITGSPRPGCWLPVTLLDGAFQVDSATRSGFRKHSGLPKSVKSIRWIPEILQTLQVECFSCTGSDATDRPGSLFFSDNQQKNVLLRMDGILLTPVPPLRGAR